MARADKPTRDEFRASIARDFGASSTPYARGLVVGVATQHMPALNAQAARLGLKSFEITVVGERTALQVFGFRRVFRASRKG